jgi:hypothetical protein
MWRQGLVTCVGDAAADKELTYTLNPQPPKRQDADVFTLAAEAFMNLIPW